MSSLSGPPKFADSYLIEVLDEFGLAIKYVRAAGNQLYYLDKTGAEVGVLDCASGFGSLMFGHNNPELVAHAKSVLDAQTPVHAQFAGYSYGIDVAAALNKIIRRELNTEDKYFALYANTGAEAVEVSIKHAELDRGIRIAELTAEVGLHVDQGRSAVATGATVSADAYALLGLAASADPAEGFERIAAEIGRRNAETSARQPLFLALEGGFHGKLASSVQLTYNEEFRLPFRALAAQARFVPLDRPDLIGKIVDDERAVLFDVAVEDGVVDLIERDFPVFTAFYVEPILGEAGIRPISTELAQAIREACDTAGCPLVADEIQCGMGRSGTFLASTQIGLRADYIVLAKSLGGGIAKTGTVLVHESRYRKDFELIHTSTFGKDGFSTLVALKVLEMLEAEDGLAYRLARERGAKAEAMLNAVRADFPDVVKEVRGLGLMLGIEFHDQGSSSSAEIRDWVEHEALAYVIGGHLLHRHRIRIFSTASSLNTMRFEPSIYLTDEEIAQFDAALRDVCGILRDQDASRFVTA
ncbi:aminotransferase class III-fold pyridoxal phosphate-dependent enzyme [Micromonospora sp. NPDC049523]|uniref:aspartate aminotransferase family protein n=1 Tax=Micromonospora sp. NPDC049523 TaxID=3155921 RepID=UPI00343F04E6